MRRTVSDDRHAIPGHGTYTITNIKNSTIQYYHHYRNTSSSATTIIELVGSNSSSICLSGLRNMTAISPTILTAVIRTNNVSYM